MIEFRGISSCQLLGCGLSAPWPRRWAVVTETLRVSSMSQLQKNLYIYNQIKSISFFVPLLRQRITKRCVAVDHHLVFLNIPWQVLARSAAQWSWPTSRPRSNVAAVEDEEKHGHFQRASRWPWTRDAGEGIQRCPG